MNVVIASAFSTVQRSCCPRSCSAPRSLRSRPTSFTTIIFFSSTAVIKSFVFVPNSVRGSFSSALPSFSRFVSINEYHSAHLGLDVQLLGTVININQQQVVKQQVLDKIIFIEPLLICYQKILDLESWPSCLPCRHHHCLRLARRIYSSWCSSNTLKN